MPATKQKKRKIYKSMAFRPETLKVVNVLASENNLSVQETVEQIILGNLEPSDSTRKEAETIELPPTLKTTPETRFKNPETGEVYTVAAWCELLNITHRQFVGRLTWANRSGDFSNVFTPGTEDDRSFRYADLTHDGETMTTEEWADKLEMSYNQFRDRYRRYYNLNTVEKAFEPINNFGAFKYKQLTYNNETLTAEEWSIKLEMPFENFRMRYNDYNKKGQVEKAFIAPRKEYFGTEELTHKGLTLTAEQWAKRLGMTYTQFRKRYWRFSDLGRVQDAFTPFKTNLTKFADDLLTHPTTGETMTVREWSKKLNQTVAQLYPKVRKYGNDTENMWKIFEPLKRKGRVKK